MRSPGTRPRNGRSFVAWSLTAGIAVMAVLVWQGAWPGLARPPAARDSAPVGIAYHTTDTVNLRSGPSLSAAVIDVLDPGTPVIVTGEASGGFLPVAIVGAAAWVAGDYLAPADAPAVAGPAGDSLVRAGLVEAVVAAEPESVADEAEIPAEAPGVLAGETSPAEPVALEREAIQAAAVEAPAAESGERWIEVDRSTALVMLHEGEAVIATYQGKIGRDPSPDGFYSTAIGTYHVYMKNKELTETPFAERVYLTDFVGFDPERSNGFHSPVRDAAGDIVETQGATTLGCVRLEADAAEALFDFAFIGMRVEIHD